MNPYANKPAKKPIMKEFIVPTSITNKIDN